MLIALDFDDTWTQDPDLWRAFVKLGKSRGHQFVMITMRCDHGPETIQIKNEVGDLMPILFSNRQLKRQYARQAGYKPDIWIDDTPEFIVSPTVIGE